MDDLKRCLQDVYDQIEPHLLAIESHFKSEIKITLIARLPDNDEADFIMSTDNLAKAIEALKRRIKKL